MSKRMKKADVEQRYDHGRYYPTINVKWHPWLPNLIRKFEGTTTTSKNLCAVCGQARFSHVEKRIAVVSAEGVTHRDLEQLDHKFKPGGEHDTHEFSQDTEFWAWVHELDDDDNYEAWEDAYEIAREVGWEDAKDFANDVFPQNVKVYSEGRSGGWLVVHGLPDVEDWDAIDLGRWAKYVRGVQSILDDLDYQLIWHLHVNVWEPQNEDAKRRAEVLVRA